jgi:GTPase SAR1 family protein
VKRWKKKVEEECGTIPMVLVQNKMDLLYNSAVDRYIFTFMMILWYSLLIDIQHQCGVSMD